MIILVKIQVHLRQFSRDAVLELRHHIRIKLSPRILGINERIGLLPSPGIAKDDFPLVLDLLRPRMLGDITSCEKEIGGLFSES